MADDRRAGNHAFDERGGTCRKCGLTWPKYWDKDSPDYHRPCPGQQSETRNSMPIDEE